MQPGHSKSRCVFLRLYDTSNLPNPVGFEKRKKKKKSSAFDGVLLLRESAPRDGLLEGLVDPRLTISCSGGTLERHS